MTRGTKHSEDGKGFEAKFFVLRSTLLPFDVYTAWSEGLAAFTAEPDRLEEALRADCALLRERLASWIEAPEVAEALYVASPSLVGALGLWREDPDSRKGKRCERSLVRYLARMVARATPFGLFAGNTLGQIGEATRLELAPRTAYVRRSRLDLDFVFSLADALGRRAEVRRSLVCRPNSSLYLAAGSWHYVETRIEADGLRAYHLVEVESSEYLDEVIRRAAAGARPAELAGVLVELLGAGEVTLEEALEFVDELIASQVLVCDLVPALTGEDPVDALIGRLEQLGTAEPGAARAAASLGASRAALAEIDAAGLGAAPLEYRKVVRPLAGLPVEPDSQRFCQVDLWKPAAEVTLGPDVLEEIRRGIGVVHRVGTGSRQSVLARFREAFIERYGEGRKVALTEVLDDETGIGFDRSEAPAADMSPLLAALDFESAGASRPTLSWERRDEVLLRRLEAAWQEGAREIELTDRDLEELVPDRETPPMPDAFHVMGRLAAVSRKALAEGDFRFLFAHASGPSGVRSAGRFCHGDTRLRRAVEEHLRAEEELGGDAVFAEIVHLPQGRMGNVLARPVLRRYEIPFLARSGAPEEFQIPIDDLYLTVVGERAVLESARLGREVVPRLTTAHNYESFGIALYRLLAFFQNQSIAGGVYWSWGQFESVTFLPRVRSGRLVFSRARWRVTREELEPLRRAVGADRFRAVQRWRGERGLPRWSVLEEGLEELVIDFANVLAVDAFLEGTRGNTVFTLTELFPPPGELTVRGPEGYFTSEMIIPFVRVRPAKTEAPAATAEAGTVPAPRGEPAGAPEVRRSFLPGSEWLYAKLYTGPVTADPVLCETIAPLVRQVLGEGADSWFFLRYGDPDTHLRLRIHGEPGRLTGSVLPRLLEAVAPLREEGRLHRLELGTYEREVERYGGPRAIAVAERLFHADSEAVVQILETLTGERGPDLRWRLALLGVDRLVTDSGYAGADQLGFLEELRRASLEFLGEGKPLRLQLDRQFRARRRELEALLDPAREDEGLAPGLAALDQRSRRTAPLWAELRRLEAGGELTSPLGRVVSSMAHMHVNRMIHAAAPAHELVIYDYLCRLHGSALARSRSKKKTQAG